VVLSGKFDSAWGLGFAPGLWPASSGGKWGYIDATGQWVVDPQFEGARNFADGLAPVIVGGKWGYIDQKGKFLVNPQYDSGDEFFEGRAIVFTNERGFGILDTKGRVVTELKSLADITAFYPPSLSQYHAPAQVRVSHILFKTVGKDENTAKALAEDVLKKAKAPGADFAALAKQYSEDPLSKDNGGDIGYLDHGFSCDLLVSAGRPCPQVASQITSREFEEASFGLKRGEVSGLFKDRWRKTYHIIKVVDSKPQTTRLVYIGRFGNGLAPTATSEGWGYVDYTGKMVVSPQFDFADEFRNGLARVTVAGKEAYITTSGAFVVDPFPGMGMQEFLSAKTLVGQWCGGVHCIKIVPLKLPSTFTVKTWNEEIGEPRDGIVATLTGSELKGSDGKLSVRVRSKEIIAATFLLPPPNDDVVQDEAVLKRRNANPARRQ
jgi:hypothetical protein